MRKNALRWKNWSIYTAYRQAGIRLLEQGHMLALQLHPVAGYCEIKNTEKYTFRAQAMEILGQNIQPVFALNR